MKSGAAIAVYDVFMMSYVNNLLPFENLHFGNILAFRSTTNITIPFLTLTIFFSLEIFF